MSTEPTVKSVKTLPGLDTPIVRAADHARTPAKNHRIHAIRTPDGWEWAHLGFMVTGWRVVAAGTFPAADFTDAEAVTLEIGRRWQNGIGGRTDGFDELSHEAFLQRGIYAHIRREDKPDTGYCGETGGRAVFDTKEDNHAQQHCVDCDRAYRAAHYGRVAVTY